MVLLSRSPIPGQIVMSGVATGMPLLGHSELQQKIGLSDWFLELN